MKEIRPSDLILRWNATIFDRQKQVRQLNNLGRNECCVDAP